MSWGGGKQLVLAVELENRNIIYFADTRIVRAAIDNKEPYLAEKIFKFNFQGTDNEVFIGADVRFGKVFYVEFIGNYNSIDFKSHCFCSGGIIHFKGNENILVIHEDSEIMPKAKIIFSKNCNYAYIGAKSKIYPSARLIFSGNNAVAYCCGPLNIRHLIQLTMGSIFFHGEYNNNTTIVNHKYLALEGQNILIGCNTMFSTNILIRTSDIHLIYDNDTLKRINTGKSIIIGDHVWIGQETFIFKGAKIEDGCVVGARSIVTGHIPENSICAGCPAKVKKLNIFWDKKVTADFTRDELQKYETYKYPKTKYKPIGYSKLIKIDAIKPELKSKEKVKLIHDILKDRVS